MSELKNQLFLSDTNFLRLVSNFDQFYHKKGNMWAQSWSNIFEMVKPFPDAIKVDLTQILKDKGFTAKKIFDVNF